MSGLLVCRHSEDFDGPCSGCATAWIAEAKAEARREALEEAARAMNPMLRSMVSRSEAARIIRALAKEPKP